MLTRRSFLQKSMVATAAAIGVPSVSEGWAHVLAGPTVEEVYSGALVIDSLVNSGPFFDVEAAIDAGLTACITDLPIYPRNFINAVGALRSWNSAFGAEESRFLKVLRAAHIEEAKKQKKLGIVLACQDAAILDASTGSVNDYNLQNLNLFYELGLRVLQLTHNERNAVGDSFREKNDGGLSRLGETVVAEMNKLGILIDLSHCSDKTSWEAIRLSTKPCAFTHTGCRALYPTLRNKPDDLIRAVAEQGGICGIFNMSIWLTDRETTSLDDVLNHIEHVVKIAGLDHVAFGSDGPVLQNPNLDAMVSGMKGYVERNLGLPGAERVPSHVMVPELNSPQRLLRLAQGLERRGYKGAQIEKIIGGNVVRLFREVAG